MYFRVADVTRYKLYRIWESQTKYIVWSKIASDTYHPRRPELRIFLG